ncbi:MAG: glycosyltransferase family 2 protein [Myxococcales bacterium]|nr:MAG: glycosyltransferase family 2 protein [Myxococcales bacterium]
MEPPKTQDSPARASFVVGIVIATMKRPRMVEELLCSIGQLRFTTGAPQLEIVVVDNDPEASAKKACEQIQSTLPWPVRYVVEAQQGIPFARNRGVKETHEGCDFIVFVDDDERVDNGWLEALLDTQRLYHADVVAGPVESILPQNAPSWATRGKIYRHLSYAEGTQLSWCATGNVLMRSSIFSVVSPWFDERLSLTGGSDRHFFHEFIRQGFGLFGRIKPLQERKFLKVAFNCAGCCNVCTDRERAMVFVKLTSSEILWRVFVSLRPQWFPYVLALHCFLSASLPGLTGLFNIYATWHMA